MTTILYTRKNSIYKQLGQDCYDQIRNAKTWPGGNPIIAHPPCRAWGNYSYKAKPREDEKNLAIHAVIMVRLWGGVLEHPARSKLWETMKLPMPGRTDQYGGWTLNIDQYWFGHQGIKNTFLYIVGITHKELPPIPYKLRQSARSIENMGRPQREATPEELAKWLIQITTIIKQKSNGHRLLNM